jgi:nucleoside-diphosphate-sugar epimerase
MKAFITGGSGFIGTNLVADLSSDGVEVLNYDRSPPLDPGHRPYWVEGGTTPHMGLRRGLRSGAGSSPK